MYTILIQHKTMYVVPDRANNYTEVYPCIYMTIHLKRILCPFFARCEL